jgi:hypothetical protein
MTPFQAVVWTCVVLFILTAGVTLLALVGRLRLGGGGAEAHEFYLRRLFRALVLEVIVAAVGAFGLYIKQQGATQPANISAAPNRSAVRDESKLDGFKHWVRGTAHWERAQQEVSDPAAYAKSLNYALDEYEHAVASEPENVSWKAHEATVLNELGSYAQAEALLRTTVGSPTFKSADAASRGWALAEFAIALLMQHKEKEAQLYSEQSYAVGENFRGYLRNTIQKYRSNDLRRQAERVDTKQADLKPIPAPEPSIVPDRLLRYTYTVSGKECDGYFARAPNSAWTEYTLGKDGCVATLYKFVELSVDTNSTIIHDASRGYYVRLPTNSGWAELATSPSGPWSAIHKLTEVK